VKFRGFYHKKIKRQTGYGYQFTKVVKSTPQRFYDAYHSNSVFIPETN